MLRRDSDGRRAIVALGSVYIVLSVVASVRSLSGSGSWAVAITYLLTAGPGVVLLYGGYHLRKTSVRPALYLRVAGWCLGAPAATIAIVGLAAGGGVVEIGPSALVLTALASVAGFITGIYDALARTRAAEAERRGRELVRRDRQLESVSRMMAHELRNPLTIAQLYHNEQRTGNEAAAREVSAALERIEESIDALLVTVRDPTARLDEEPIDVGEIAVRAWDNLALQTASATLVVETAATVRGDGVYVRRLLTNLFQNSLEHGGSAVTVRVGDLEDGFYVADDGPGVPDADYETVVEAGFTTKRRGTGLGLTFVAHLAELYEWEVTLAESDNGGMRLEFRNVDLVYDEGELPSKG